MDKKIFFFDFDGTLRIEQTDEVTEATYESFNHLKTLGYPLFLNTGRSFNALGDLVFTLPFDGFICGCGTYIKYHDEVLLEAKLPQNEIQEVLDCLDKYKVEAYFEGHRGLFRNHIESDYMKNQIESIEKRGLVFLPTSDPSFHFVKMSVHYPNDEARVHFENEMSKYFDFILRNEDETEVVLKGYSKGLAMERILEQFGIEKENSYAFGDSNNDEEMLLSAGNSILIGNQAKHLIDKVTFVSKSAKEDGVTYALRKLGVLELQNSPTIETQRFILRKFTDEDIDDLHEILSDEVVNTYLPWFVSQTKEDTKKFLEERVYAEYAKGISYYYAIEEKATGKVIGYVDVDGIDYIEKCGDLGYGIHRDYWKQGIATEVSQAVLAQLKKDGFAYVTATHDKNNVGSGKVMRKTGLTYRYSYEEQWQPKDFLVVFRLYQIELNGEHETFMKYWQMYPNHYVEEI